MAWIKVIDESEATGMLREIYQVLLRKRGKVANIMKVHSLNPPSMKAHLDLYVTIMFGKSGLSRPEKEMIAVVVSKINHCDYCVTHHANALNFYWKDEVRIRQFMDDFRKVALSDREHAILRYAENLTVNPANVKQEDVTSLRRCGFSDADILDINLIVSYFNFVNRIALGLGVEFTPEEADGYKF